MAPSRSNRLLKTNTRPAGRRRRGHPVRVTLPSTPAPYALATGLAAAHRLRILHGLYGPGSRRVLLEAGLRSGMRVGDFGCGVGLVTALLAELVGPEGHVVGLDASAAQLAQARERMPADGTNVRFVEASATDSGLPPASFDLVYCRFLLLHLPEPDRALREMGALLKPNGILVCEDGDLTSAGSELSVGTRARVCRPVGPGLGNRRGEWITPSPAACFRWFRPPASRHAGDHLQSTGPGTR